MLTEERCDLCGSEGLEPVYTPPDSRRGMVVLLCLTCGLMQSLRGKRKASEAGNASGGGGEAPGLEAPSMKASSGADWGNIRYGKGFRTASAMELMSKYLNLAEISSCLDIGSNRGSFIKALREINEAVEIAAVEPDSRVTGDYAGTTKVNTINACLEDAPLDVASFDLAYSCHTIEHVDSPRESLGVTWRALKPGAILYVEAPRLDIIEAPDFLEEFFIDKHSFHFTEKTLLKYLHNAGFEILNHEETGDGENIALVMRKVDKGAILPPDDPGEVNRGHSLIDKYKANLLRNRKAMKGVGAFINSLASAGGKEGGQVAVWGAGRLFDSLVRYGSLEEGAIDLLIDRYLVKYMDETNGFKIVHPNAAAESSDGTDIDTVIIMSRAFEAEIRIEIKEKLPSVSRVYAFSALLEGAL